jgi:hypothetical protein
MSQQGAVDSVDILLFYARHQILLDEFNPKARSMDHHEAVRKFEHLMLKEADHAREVATELEALVPILTTENSRQLAQVQIKASHKQAKEFRELAEKVKEK